MQSSLPGEARVRRYPKRVPYTVKCTQYVGTNPWPLGLERQMISSQERLHLPATTLARVCIRLACFLCAGVREIPIRSGWRGLYMFVIVAWRGLNTQLPGGGVVRNALLI